jgi:hypothetical protein
MNREAILMVVHPSVPAKTIPEFIVYAKANPGKVSFASAGNGTTPHVAGELFKLMAGVDMVHVPYRGAAPAMTDLLGGQVQVVFAGVSNAIEYIKALRLRALAVTTATRSEALPDVPTVGEFIKDFEASQWYGVGAPRNTPVEIIDKLNKEINASLSDPKIKARLADLGGSPLASSPAEFAKLIAEDADKWGKLIRAANVRPEYVSLHNFNNVSFRACCCAASSFLGSAVGRQNPTRVRRLVCLLPPGADMVRENRLLPKVRLRLPPLHAGQGLALRSLLPIRPRVRADDSAPRAHHAMELNKRGIPTAGAGRV